jgi:NADH-quinone oxidoreductase subunit C
VTQILNGQVIADKLKDAGISIVMEAGDNDLLVDSNQLLDIACFLKDTPDLYFNYLSSLTVVDYKEYFELIYHLTSLKHNHSFMLKTRCQDRNKPEITSVFSIWRGADLQEREVYDLFGIVFNGHPNLKRLFLWEGFKGYPLRKDYNNDA